MIFADKLIALRKKAGYSQEELAQQLNVTRQSVSKWEGAQSVPDIEKILQISKLFGVTTDYLLKDEMGEPEYAESEPTALRRVTLEQANAAPLFLMRLPASGIPFCAPWRRVFTFRFRGALPPQTTAGPAGSAFPQQSSAWFRCAR